MVIVLSILFAGSLLVNLFLGAIKYYDIKRDEKQRDYIDELTEQNSRLGSELDSAFERIYELEAKLRIDQYDCKVQ